jgi:crossover junction endodeoxyribonuclease RuvC
VTVLGIDPGLERIGFGVVRRTGSQLAVVEHGLIKTPRIATPERLNVLYQDVCALLDRANPDAVATERLFFAKNQTTAIDVAKALGVVQLACAQHGLECTEYSPPEVKLSVVGNGAAEKDQVAYMVVKLLGLKEKPRPDDVADALAVALTHALRAGSQAVAR